MTVIWLYAIPVLGEPAEVRQVISEEQDTWVSYSQWRKWMLKARLGLYIYLVIDNGIIVKAVKRLNWMEKRAQSSGVVSGTTVRALVLGRFSQKN